MRNFLDETLIKQLKGSDYNEYWCWVLAIVQRQDITGPWTYRAKESLCWEAFSLWQALCILADRAVHHWDVAELEIKTGW